MKHFFYISTMLVLFLTKNSFAQQSTCYGTTQHGRLEYGVKLPAKGINFISYGTYPELANQTYVHSRVKNIIIEAYRILAVSRPNTLYKYAETGFENGGRFPPHKTHQNGLSCQSKMRIIIPLTFLPQKKTDTAITLILTNMVIIKITISILRPLRPIS